MIQNLKDAGCCSKTIEKVCRLYRNGEVHNAMKTLRRHRCGLMDSLHERQEEVDCLDFLLWRMEKEDQSSKTIVIEREESQNGKYHTTGIDKGMG